MYNMLTLLEKLSDSWADIRGDHTPSVKLELSELRRKILENTEMETLCHSPAGKKLVKTVIDYIEKIDSVCQDEQVKGEVKLDLLKQRKAWLIVLRTLMGGKSELEAIQTQIRTYLQE
jgi:hypothetical protein